MDRKRTPEAGFSADGFIVDQDCFESVRYRCMPASINGCGWIAAYDLRRALGEEPDWREVCREMDALHRLRVPGPTLISVMRAYLARWVPEARETRGREAALEAASHSRAGVFRYREKQVPHFVAYVREGGEFRFFNVADALEDCRMSMERFGAEHCAQGNVIVFAVPEGEEKS